jgi:hypothetical protein
MMTYIIASWNYPKERVKDEEEEEEREHENE